MIHTKFLQGYLYLALSLDQVKRGLEDSAADVNGRPRDEVRAWYWLGAGGAAPI